MGRSNAVRSTAVANGGTVAETELHYLDATTARALFRSGDLSPVELLRAVMERTDALNPQVNALTERLVGEAMAGAKDAERQFRTGGELPPLLGIPVATKEKHALAGRVLSNGLVAQQEVIADSDHPVVDRIRRAGGIIHERTTTPEFCCATVTHSPLWGVTRNPWNLGLSPGGSSGGSGAALAAGFAPLATGSDIAGSTRLPAAFTGTVGFKAPYGRVPGSPPLSADHYRGDGPMARTVADTALLANVMAGPHRDDHSSLASAPQLPAEWPSVAGLHIALCVRLGDYVVDVDVEANTRAVADALRSAGALVEEIELPWSTAEIHQTAFTHFGHILGPAMEDETAGGEHLLAPYTRQFMADARTAARGSRYLDGLRVESRMQGELARGMDGFDALICPTSAVASLRADGEYLDGLSASGVHLRHYWQGHMTVPFNIANRYPVLAVPSGMATCGIPTGVQIVGHPFDDDMVFRVGAAVETLRPWAQRYALVTSRTRA
ncbi:amidase [Cryobacterium psychrophilum]|uniref:Amidase n=1 Tax=Cryobacterium psychrophilum TaxID=41988 RepID=A0A4Y8KQI2_9MICO|nr:amidase [Cryobacterium psychrophilum]TDW29465.1 aspartyl-tRNA(Asn)/glutamyl-tRNA(Gln) amidotransferase subunit A [Cryobacterium psychrophilum]TFD81401.1 amidase [Cryobacterium psychrophilum]